MKTNPEYAAIAIIAIIVGKDSAMKSSTKLEISSGVGGNSIGCSYLVRVHGDFAGIVSSDLIYRLLNGRAHFGHL